MLTLKQQINDELKAMAAAGKSAQIDDVTVVVNLAEVEGTDDVVNKPHIDVATDGNKVKLIRSLHRQHRQELVHQPDREIHRRC